jgi:dienelactone hydrolase
MNPVFYGFMNYPDTPITEADPPKRARMARPPLADGLDPMRVYYPSLDVVPKDASVLTACGRYPLVLLIHGDCGGDPLAQWQSLPVQLARCGFVVVVTAHGGYLAQGDPASTASFHRTHDWMRNSWSYRDCLLPPPSTAVVGHSYGGTLAAQLASEIPVTAFAGLSGVYGQELNPLALLASIVVPSLFLWNDTDDAPLGAQVYNLSDSSATQMWSSIGTPSHPKHGVLFQGAKHGDYLDFEGESRCSRGPCRLVRPLAADLVTTFLSRYLPPENAPNLASSVPDSLIVWPQDLPAPTLGVGTAGPIFSGLAASRNSLRLQKGATCVEIVLWQTTSNTQMAFLIPS